MRRLRLIIVQEEHIPIRLSRETLVKEGARLKCVFFASLRTQVRLGGRPTLSDIYLTLVTITCVGYQPVSVMPLLYQLGYVLK